MEICSNRIKSIKSDIRGENYRKSLELEAGGEKILKLNTGNPAAFGFKMPESVKNALIENIGFSLGYTDVRGTAAAREAILSYHESKGIKNISIDDIYTGNGVSEIASMISTVLINPGDEVLLPLPCYSLWHNEILLRDGVPVFYNCDEKNSWAPDVNHIKKLISPKTKAILIINPNNPTGALYSDKTLREIADIAEKNNLIVLADEIYDRLLFDGKKHKTFASFSENVTTVTMNGLSKSHCLCGFRCGWLVLSGPRKKEINDALIKVASMRLCPGALMQQIIPVALKDTQYTENFVKELDKRRKAVFSALDEIKEISYVKNEGGFYIFPKIHREILNDKKFAYDLLCTKQILIVPGSGFSYDNSDHFRIVMLPDEKTLTTAIGKIGEFVREM